MRKSLPVQSTIEGYKMNFFQYTALCLSADVLWACFFSFYKAYMLFFFQLLGLFLEKKHSILYVGWSAISAYLNVFFVLLYSFLGVLSWFFGIFLKFTTYPYMDTCLLHFSMIFLSTIFYRKIVCWGGLQSMFFFYLDSVWHQ